MTLVTLLDLENSLKINQFLNSHTNTSSSHTKADFESPPLPQNNLNLLINSHNLNKNSILTSAMMHQIQNQNLYNRSLILNCIQSNSMGAPAIPESQKSQINSGRYKTELCRQFIENGGCKYGDKCQFAHGISDLKDVNRHPKYKTDYCKTFHSKGFCPYGPRCHFIHELNEKFEASNVNSAIKKPKCPEASRSVDSQLDKQFEALQTRLSTNFFSNNESPETNYNLAVKPNQFAEKLESEKQNNQMDELNNLFYGSSLISSPQSSSPASPMRPQRTRSGMSSTSSLVSSSSSYDLNQSTDSVFSPVKSQQPMSYNIPISKNLIQIGRNLINEKLNNPDQDHATLNQQIYQIEKLNNLLNSNQLNFNYDSVDRQRATW